MVVNRSQMLVSISVLLWLQEKAVNTTNLIMGAQYSTSHTDNNMTMNMCDEDNQAWLSGRFALWSQRYLRKSIQHVKSRIVSHRQGKKWMNIRTIIYGLIIGDLVCYFSIWTPTTVFQAGYIWRGSVETRSGHRAWTTRGQLEPPPASWECC